MKKVSYLVMFVSVLSMSISSCEQGGPEDDLSGVDVGTSGGGRAPITTTTTTSSSAAKDHAEANLDTESVLATAHSLVKIGAATFAQTALVSIEESAENGSITVKAVDKVTGQPIVPAQPIEYCLSSSDADPDGKGLLFQPTGSSDAEDVDENIVDDSFITESDETYVTDSQVCSQTFFANGSVEVVEPTVAEDATKISSDYSVVGADWVVDATQTGAAARIAHVATASVTLLLKPAREDVTRFYVTTHNKCRKGGKWRKLKKHTDGFSLDLANLQGSNEIYVKYRKGRKDQTPCYASTIVHNDQAPTEINAVIAGGEYANSSNVALTLSAKNAAQVYISNTAGCASGGEWQDYTAAPNWTLAQTNGTATVYVKFRSAAKVETSCLSDTIVHDDVGPTGGSLVIDGGNATSDSTPNLTLGATDATQMYVTNDATCASGGSWETYATAKVDWPLSQTNATASVYVKYRDVAGNETDCFKDTIVHDDTGPSSASMTIDSGNSYTTDSTPDLTLSAVDASEMYITNTAGCASGGSWVTYATSSTGWSLAQTNQVATVYAKFRDEKSNETACLSDSIIHDTVAPTSVSLTIDGGTHTSDSTPNLTLAASGAADMYITNTAGCASGGSWVTYSTVSSGWSLGQTNGTATVYAKFRDAAGNEGSCVNDTITHDNIAPTSPSVSISSGASYVSSSSTSLALSASDASEMYVTNTAGCGSGGSWESYGNSKAGWSLGQTNGTATVYAKFRDEAANETSCVSDTIVHDSTAPSAPSSVDDSSQGTTSSVTVSWGAGSDAGSGVASYEVSIGTSAGDDSVSAWASAGTGSSYTVTGLSLTDGSTYYANIRTVDQAGNTSSSTDGDGFTATAPSHTIAAGENHTCVLLTTGAVKCWGNSAYGQLGYDDNTQRDTSGEMGSALGDVNLGTGRTATQIDAGDSFTCAVLDNSELKCWGANQFGKLGQGNITTVGNGSGVSMSALSAIDLGTNRTASQVSTGEHFTCALLDNGDVKCWGYAFFGVLGQGNANDLGDDANEMGDNMSAIDLGTNRTATQISAGDLHVCAVLDNGTTKCWGSHQYGKLGSGAASGYAGDAANEMGDNLPVVDVGTNRTVSKIVAGDEHTCAILDNSTVKCWGRNTEGQLGLGSVNDHRGDAANEMGDNLPVVDLGTNRTAKDLVAGGDDVSKSHTCAILDDDTMKCWGRNANGQLGKGNTNDLGDGGSEMGDNLTAIDLGTSRTAKKIAIGGGFTCAVLDNNDAKCWGKNSNGQLGQGHTNDLGDGGSEMGSNLNAILWE